MYNILTPIPTEEEQMQRQLKAVTELPVRTDAVTVTLLYVFKELETELGGTVSLREYSDVPETVTSARDRLESAGYTVDVLVGEGNPGDTILSVATAEDADHVVVVGRNRSPTGKALFGSVTQAVALNADVPVTIVPETSYAEPIEQ